MSALHPQHRKVAPFSFAKYHTVLLQELPTRVLRLGANVLEGRLLNVFESLAIGLPSTILATVGYTVSRFEASVLCFLESVLLRLCRAEFPFLLQLATAFSTHGKRAMSACALYVLLHPYDCGKDWWKALGNLLRGMLLHRRIV